MGELLSISLASTLFCTLFILPALLGPASQTRAVAAPAQPEDGRRGAVRPVSEPP
jgi:hypothetical protein